MNNLPTLPDSLPDNFRAVKLCKLLNNKDLPCLPTLPTQNHLHARKNKLSLVNQ